MYDFPDSILTGMQVLLPIRKTILGAIPLGSTPFSPGGFISLDAADLFKNRQGLPVFFPKIKWYKN